MNHGARRPTIPNEWKGCAILDDEFERVRALPVRSQCPAGTGPARTRAFVDEHKRIPKSNGDGNENSTAQAMYDAIRKSSSLPTEWAGCAILEQCCDKVHAKRDNRVAPFGSGPRRVLAFVNEHKRLPKTIGDEKELAERMIGGARRPTIPEEWKGSAILEDEVERVRALHVRSQCPAGTGPARARAFVDEHKQIPKSTGDGNENSTAQAMYNAIHKSSSLPTEWEGCEILEACHNRMHAKRDKYLVHPEGVPDQNSLNGNFVGRRLRCGRGLRLVSNSFFRCRLRSSRRLIIRYFFSRCLHSSRRLIIR
jgi:hypothetical protein